MGQDIHTEINSIEQRVAECYKVKGYRCELCKSYCREKGLQLRGPLSFFNIGKDFERDQYKVVFVGKTHWYNKDQVEEIGFLEQSRFRDCRDDGTKMFLTRHSRFWGCIQDITKKLYPEQGSEELPDLLDRIAITNITKCNTSSDYRDTTPYYLTENCLEIFEEEVKALRPKHIIFFTGRDYDLYIDKLTFGYSVPPRDITKRTHKKEIKTRCSLWWWHREFCENNKMQMRFLRTRHPQGAPREIVDEIVKWIRKDKEILV
ncbi:hypothetical protein G4O51_12715 [Candidatus Bathyarchaeota archaeon A05DMB-2]|jgi:hypothetical protein|nr:hypothetical protein [Candidatus Bathyarchaeota archaeon A05DMB-2]